MLSAIAGIFAFVAGIVVGRPELVIAATLGPLVFSLLWGRQYGAGLVAAYNVARADVDDLSAWRPVVIDADGLQVDWSIEDPSAHRPRRDRVRDLHRPRVGGEQALGRQVGRRAVRVPGLLSSFRGEPHGPEEAL
jgi:hypothetical protein